MDLCLDDLELKRINRDVKYFREKQPSNNPPKDNILRKI